MEPIGRSDSEFRRSAAALAVITAMLACYGILCVTALRDKGATFDEPSHMIAAWLQTHYFDFRWDVAHPPLWKYVAALGTRADELKMDRQSYGFNRPLVRPEPDGTFVLDTLYRTQGNDPDQVLWEMRKRMIVFPLAMGVLLAWWAWRLAGRLAAIVATAAFAFDPNFLAHEALVKNDVAAAFAFLAVMAAAWQLGRRASLGHWCLMWLSLGVALSIKLSTILALPMLGLALLLRAAIRLDWQVLRWKCSSFFSRFLAGLVLGVSCLLMAWLVVWANYDFRFAESSDPAHQADFSQVLETYHGRRGSIEHPLWAAEKAAAIGHQYHLMPEAWLIGFVVTFDSMQSRHYFLLNQYSDHAWWYYFPLAMLYKTPTAMIAALLLALLVWVIQAMAHRSRAPSPGQRWVWAIAICPVMYLLVSIAMGLNLGIRHVLVVYPFLYLFLGVVAARTFKARPRITAAILAILGVGLLAETVGAYPDYIPFFNTLAGGPSGGLDLLSDSNLDWGQDLPAVGRWQRQHPDVTLYLIYFGSADPMYYGIKYYDHLGDSNHRPKPADLVGKRLIFGFSGTELQGTYTSPKDRAARERYRRVEPIASFGHSIFLFNPLPEPVEQPAASNAARN